MAGQQWQSYWIRNQTHLFQANQLFRRLPVINAAPPHPKVDNIAASTSGEALPVITVGIDAQTWHIVIMKRTQPDKAGGGRFEFHKLADKFG